MKFKELLRKAIENKVGRYIFIVILLIIFVFTVTYISYNKKRKVDTEYLITTLKESSELTASILNYTGFTLYEDEGIPVISRGDFLMVYNATARTGIDLEEVKIYSDIIKKKIWVEIPKSRILDVKVDANTVKYYDEKFALFNFDTKEDANKAIALAEEKARKELSEMGIDEINNKHIKSIIRGLIGNIIPKGYKLDFKEK